VGEREGQIPRMICVHVPYLSWPWHLIPCHAASRLPFDCCVVVGARRTKRRVAPTVLSYLVITQAGSTVPVLVFSWIQRIRVVRLVLSVRVRGRMYCTTGGMYTVPTD